MQLTANLVINRLHMHNAYLLKERERASDFVGGHEKAAESIIQFGFHLPTSCGYCTK